MIGINSLVQLKRGPLTKGQVTGLYETSAGVTAWIKWDDGFIDTHNVRELREVAKFYGAGQKI